MRKIFFILSVMVMVFEPAVFAQMKAARDWHNYHKFHVHIQEAIQEVEIARRANHFEITGHGRNTEDLLCLAEKELQMANISTNSN